MSDWTTIDAEINHVVAASEDPFLPATIANARDLLSFVRERCPVPYQVGKGYRNTICLSWHVPSGDFQVEVYDDHVELYRFYPGKTDIKHVAHRPGETFPETFSADLPML